MHSPTSSAHDAPLTSSEISKLKAEVVQAAASVAVMALVWPWVLEWMDPTGSGSVPTMLAVIITMRVVSIGQDLRHIGRKWLLAFFVLMMASVGLLIHFSAAGALTGLMALFVWPLLVRTWRKEDQRLAASTEIQAEVRDIAGILGALAQARGAHMELPAAVRQKRPSTLGPLHRIAAFFIETEPKESSKSAR